MGKLFEQLEKYGESDYYPYHMPGHKRKSCGELPEAVARLDITEIEGFDNLHQAEGILKELQDRASELYGAEETFYLVNGSTSGILSAISAALPEGGHILMARNSHKSAYHAAYLRNLTISYLYPDIFEGYDIFDAITPQQVEKALEGNGDIKAVFVVSPTYEGRIADIRAIAEVVHKKGIPLIVDEAHGAHLGLAEGFPESSCRLGADIVIHSVHKTLPAMTQTALLHVNGELINRERLKRFLHIYQSSSPSYVLMGSIDNALQTVEEQGKELFHTFKTNYLNLLEQLKVCRWLDFVVPEEGKQDIGKLVISSRRIGLSGQQIYDKLLSEYHLQLEMASGSFCLAMFTMADGADAYERMKNALLSIDSEIGELQMHGKNPCFNEEKSGEHMQFLEDVTAGELEEMPFAEAIPFARAWDMPCERVPLGEAVGRYVGEFLNLYPPGVPLLVPGEVLSQEQYEKLLGYIEQGLSVQGVEKNELYWVNVIGEKDYKQ